MLNRLTTTIVPGFPAISSVGLSGEISATGYTSAIGMTGVTGTTGPGAVA